MNLIAVKETEVTPYGSWTRYDADLTAGLRGRQWKVQRRQADSQSEA